MVAQISLELKIMELNIYPAVTTTKLFKKFGNWRNFFKEVNELKLTEVALFPTVLNSIERQEFWDYLKKSTITSVPFVHLRDDFSREEVQFLIQNYGTQRFTIHPNAIKGYIDWPERKMFYIEQLFRSDERLADFEKYLPEFGGLTVDFSHLERGRTKNCPDYQRSLELFKKYKIGIVHLNGFIPLLKFDTHYIYSLSNFDYLKNIPDYIWSDCIGLEMENSITEQLKFKNYIIKLKNE
jgi:hypothetical protein